MPDETKTTEGECDSCDYETTLYKYTDYDSKMNLREWRFCLICYSTMISNSARFPDQYRDPQVMKAIAYVGNMLLAAINKKNAS